MSFRSSDTQRLALGIHIKSGKKIENSKPRALSFSPYIISGLVMTQRYLCCLGASSPEGVGVGTFAGSQAHTSLEERAVTIKGKGKD